MPISVVVGGQFGSEGKGKVALEIARRTSASAVVRVGGTNSGHTGIDDAGTAWPLRQLPAAVLAPSPVAVLPAGALIDPAIFLREVSALQLPVGRVKVSPYATVISQADKENERIGGLIDEIGSTGSGTGAALVRRIRRSQQECVLAKDHPPLAPYIEDTGAFMRSVLKNEGRVVIEGSQGFGLSVLHGGYYPNATSRDTTAAAFVAEAGMSPLDVDDVILVIRTYPIRVAGNSGVLKGETTWAAIAAAAGLPSDYCEMTTATKKIRRVGSFDPDVVTRAIEANNPSQIVLNHFDYVDAEVRDLVFSRRAKEFLTFVEASIGQKVDWIGTGPRNLLTREHLFGAASSDFKVLVPA